MSHEEALILNALLDKYERSEFFRAGKTPTRKIQLNFRTLTGKSDFPQYNIEEYKVHDAINRAVLELERRQLISFDWLEKGHIIKSIWLNMLNIVRVYEEAGRKPKNDVIESICEQLTSAIAKIKTPWIKNFLHDEHETISKKRKFTTHFTENERNLLLDCMYAIDDLDGAECMERVFSIRTFGDSKTFESIVRPRLLRILKKYTDICDYTTEEDLLLYIGITRYPEQFEFCGEVSIKFDRGVVDFSHLKNGGTVYSYDLLVGEFIFSSCIDSIITIENKANYIDYVKSKDKNELVIFHGGHFSPRKKVFFTKIANAIPADCKWRHWSDIDYGGFLMLERLRREILPSIAAYRMSIKELEKHKSLTKKTNQSYVEKLKTLKSRPALLDCKDCIDYMVSNMLKLEQEAMLVI